MTLTRTAARDLRAGWDLQQAPFLPHRQTTFDVVFDLAATTLIEGMAGDGRSRRLRARIVDLAGGPGSLAALVRQAAPSVDVVLVDVDPVLLEIARHADAGQVTVIERDLGTPEWVAGLEHLGPVDVVSVANALHSFAPERLCELYAEIRSILAPSGALVAAEVMPEDGAPARFVGPDPMGAWRAWWTDVLARPELGAAAARRRSLPEHASADFYPSVDWHLQAMRAGGFDARVAWRKDDVTVVMARPTG